MHLYTASPPAWSPIPALDGPLPLGSLLLVDLVGGIGAIRAAIDAEAGSPWCPLYIVLSDKPVSAAILQALVDLPARARFLEAEPRNPLISRTTILAALRSVPPPAPDEIAAYIVRRTRRHDIAGILSECLARCPTPSKARQNHSRSTLSRRLSSFGPLKARDWRALVGIIRALHHPTQPDATIDQIAWACGLDPRTLRDRSNYYLGMHIGEVLEAPSWEWKVEVALRRFGYVSAGPFVERLRGAQMKSR
jgi:hypothetical protein